MKIKLTAEKEVSGLADNTHDLTLSKAYEVIGIIYYNDINITDEAKDKYYILIDDNCNISTYAYSFFEIIDVNLDNDFIYEYNIKMDIFILYSSSIKIDIFYEAYLHVESIRMDKNFINRYQHLISDYKIAELYPECYQASNIKEFGKDLGDNWIMCPKCSEAYEVKNDQGYIDCQNKTCKIRFNNPYAKKFPKGQNDETNTN